MQPNLSQILLCTHKPPSNMSHLQMRSTANSAAQDFGFTNCALDSHSSAIHTTVSRIENSITGATSTFEKCLLLSALTSKEYYISNATTYDGKDSILFQT